MTEGQKRLAVGLLAGAVGFAGGYAAGKRAALADEDRPPIIVKGGSLYFENTTPKKPGKNWKKVDPNSMKEWELDHGQGKKVAFYRVFFMGGNGTAGCALIEGEEVIVNYDHDGDNANPRQYTVKIVNEKPRLTSTYDMDVDANDKTRIVASSNAEGKISSVKVGAAECMAPTAAYVESVK